MNWTTSPASFPEPMIRIPAGATTLAGFRAWMLSDEFPRSVRATYIRGELFIEMGPTEPMIRVPAGATTLAGFRAWALSDEFPERGRISYIRGELFIDMSPEELNTHNRVKTEVGRVLSTLVKERDLGVFYSDRTMLTNDASDLSAEPDALFVSWQSYETGRIRPVPRKNRPGQSIELQGTPDWVLEIVSDSSVGKDTRELQASYHRAGVTEYWIIDARSEALKFALLRHRRDRYVVASPRAGWLRSRVFGRGFRLERRRDRMGGWEYTLQMTPE